MKCTPRSDNMNAFQSFKKKCFLCIYRWMSEFIDPVWLFHGLSSFPKYLFNWARYSRMTGAERIKLIDSYPCLHDDIATTPFDRHYFYQNIWAFQRIFRSKPERHLDIGSKIDYVSFLSAITKVVFIDIRPLMVDLDNFEAKSGSILAIPFDTGSVESISCLHVAEHIGLGRYGDPLDTSGTKRAAEELQRVLASGGNLFFSVPIGKPRLCFNAHRIHSVQQILDYFSDLQLVELSGINDNRSLILNCDREELDACDYGCGLFWFKK
jgi:hypothetical protein